jgi:hypothetical protein
VGGCSACAHFPCVTTCCACGRTVYARIKYNLFFSLVYNCVGISLGACPCVRPAPAHVEPLPLSSRVLWPCDLPCAWLPVDGADHHMATGTPCAAFAVRVFRVAVAVAVPALPPRGHCQRAQPLLRTPPSTHPHPPSPPPEPTGTGMFMPGLHLSLPPQFAGLAMAASSVSVVVSSLMLRRYQRPQLPGVSPPAGRRGAGGYRAAVAVPQPVPGVGAPRGKAAPGAVVRDRMVVGGPAGGGATPRALYKLTAKAAQAGPGPGADEDEAASLLGDAV